MRRIALLITVVALVVAVMLATSLSAGAKKRDPAPVPAPAPAPEPAPDITEPVYTCAAIGCDPNFDWESFCALYPEECLNM